MTGVLYLTTLATPASKALLQSALESLMSALADGGDAPACLYQLHYQQSRGSSTCKADGSVIQLPAPSLNLAFDDSVLDTVRQAWKTAMGSEVDDQDYMVFSDREPADAYDDADD
jgi:hypothetical protein